MPLTKPMAEHLAELAHLLRADLADRTGCPGWDARGILRQIESVAGRPAEDVCLAVIRAAVDQGAATPGVIPSDGPHWRERLSGGRGPRNPMPHEECGMHPGQFRLSCSGCASDRLATVHELHPREESADVTDWRAAFRAATADLCTHGVAPKNCLQEHPAEDEGDVTA